MNGYHHSQEMEAAYSPRCPYSNTCSMRTQCPYCPHQMEGNMEMNPVYHGNMNMQMEYYMKDNREPVFYPYENIESEKMGLENLYSDNMAGLAGVEDYNNFPAEPQYNPYGYINPDENVHSPWVNNAMYGNIVNPLPLKDCPFQ